MARSCFFVLTTRLFLFGMFLLSFIDTISPLFTNITTDQSALLSLKSHITRDPQNILASNWSISTSVCNWVGVTCGLRHQRVTVLNVSFFGLNGTIPPHLGNLSFLTELLFTNNNFHGFLPGELTRLHRLKHISFGYNNFTGEIPSWFGSISKLQVLDLYGNQFSGSLPTLIFNLSSSLDGIDLSENRLSGSIPKEIGNATMLKVLWLYENHLTGEIPREIGNIELDELLIYSNTLTGAIPSVIFNMSSLKILKLSDNDLSGGVLPNNMCLTLPNLEDLRLANCKLCGSIPAQFSQCRKLRILIFATNNLTGSIPPNMFNMSNLEQIWLSSNNFEPTTLPDNICQNLPKLEWFAMDECNLGGRILKQFSQCGKLSVLGLEMNNFIGSIPQTVGNLTSLEGLYLGGNYLTGTIPNEIGNLYNLKIFQVDQNYLGGSIPSNLFNTSNTSQITDLGLAENSFFGSLTSAFGTLRNLDTLVLDINNFTSDDSAIRGFFTSLATCKDLRILTLSNNPLNIKLPGSVGNLSNSLEQLDVSACKIRGIIPGEIGNLDSLMLLRLAENELIGPIPATIGKLQKLQALHLNDNKLQGYIPSELCQLSRLDTISLASNTLNGLLPSCFKDLTSLRHLLLGFNKLNSPIPVDLWSLSYLLEFNMSSNYLSGPLSEDVGKLKVMSIFDFSKNQFSGDIPSSIGGLRDLVFLSLAYNSFEGLIPQTLGELVNIENMDLSKNHLSGVIPKSLEKLSHLKYLNLSFNKLHGEIPNRGPFSNFSTETFMGNEALCGPPQLQVPLCKVNIGQGTRIISHVLKFVLPVVVSAILVVTLFFIWKRCKKQSVKHTSNANLLPLGEWRRVSHQELMRATNGFSDTNLLGTGSFGSVYQGKLDDGMDVAVKVFNLQIEGGLRSFDTECMLLSGLRHRNLINVISVCSNIDFKAVVLQYMPFGSLEKWLHSENHSLTLLQRLNIMIDVASAVEYLHHGYSQSIVHCDIKPSNVLLNTDMIAHVADFGISKLVSGSDSITETVTLATIGYMAPEYGLEGVVSTRGDVHSYGILLMETFTGKKPIDAMFVGELSLKKWVEDAFTHYNVTDVADANCLEGNNLIAVKDCLSSIFKLALCCTAESPIERKNMIAISSELSKVKLKFLRDI